MRARARKPLVPNAAQYSPCYAWLVVASSLVVRDSAYLSTLPQMDSLGYSKMTRAEIIDLVVTLQEQIKLQEEFIEAQKEAIAHRDKMIEDERAHSKFVEDYLKSAREKNIQKKRKREGE